MTPVAKYKAVCMLSAVVFVSASFAQNQAPQQRIQEVSSTAGRTAAESVQLTDTDKVGAEIWGLTNEEMIRAKVLLQGPRKAFSVENLSPIEALGIHARNEAERRKYAEKFARLFRADVERSLKWNAEFSAAMARMYPNDPIIDYSKMPKVEASVGAADTLGVPRANIIEKPGAGYTPITVRKAR